MFSLNYDVVVVDECEKVDKRPFALNTDSTWADNPVPISDL